MKKISIEIFSTFVKIECINKITQGKQQEHKLLCLDKTISIVFNNKNKKVIIYFDKKIDNENMYISNVDKIFLLNKEVVKKIQYNERIVNIKLDVFLKKNIFEIKQKNKKIIIKINNDDIPNIDFIQIITTNDISNKINVKYDNKTIQYNKNFLIKNSKADIIYIEIIKNINMENVLLKCILKRGIKYVD